MDRMLIYVEPVFLLALFCLAAAAVFVNSRRQAVSAGGLFRFYPVIAVPLLLAVLAGAAGLPVRHAAGFDEYAHMGIAETLASGGGLCSVKKGSSLRPEICQPAPWPGGYHTALAAWLQFPSGDREAAAGAFSFLLVLFTGLALLLAGRVLSGRFSGGLIAAFFTLSSGPYIMYFFSAETGVFSSFLALCSVLAYYLYLRRENAWNALLLVSLVCAALLTRYENILLLPFLAFFLFRNAKNPRILLKLLPLPAVALLIYFTRLFFALRHIAALNVPFFSGFPHSFAENIIFWFDPGYSDLLATAFVCAGIYKLVKEDSLLPSLFLAYLAVYSLAVPPFSDGPEFLRFALTPAALYGLMAAAGFCLAAGHLARFKNKRRVLLPAALLFLSFYLAQITLRARQHWQALPEQADRRGRFFLRANAAKVPPGAYFLTYAPPYITFATGLKAALPDYLDGIKAPLAVLKDRFWYVAAGQYPRLEPDLRERFRFRRVAVMDPSLPESEKNYSLYVLEPKGL